MLSHLGRPPPPLPWPTVQRPPHALRLHLALQSLTCLLLQHNLQQKLHPPPSPQICQASSFLPPREDGKADMDPRNHTPSPFLPKFLTIRTLGLALLFRGSIAFMKSLMSALPPDFSQRWRSFLKEHGSNSPLTSCKKRKKESIIYDVHGAVIARLRDAAYVPSASGPHLHCRSSEMPSFLWQAVVACEDRRFFQHHGVDPRGLARAILSLSSNGGGSTITQQLVKNMFLSTDRKWARKLVEMLLALLLETRMSKWDILRTYLDKIYWGHGLYGIEAASGFYFGKHPSLLKVGECAMLAGMIPAPEFLSPFQESSRGKKAQARALCRMVEVGFLEPQHAEIIAKEPLEISNGDKKAQCKAPFFVDEVLRVLKGKYGWSKVLDGGLKVYTTLDLRLQELAENIVREWTTRYDNERLRFSEGVVRQVQEELENLQGAHDTPVKKVSSRTYSEEQALRAPLEKVRGDSNVAMDARLEAVLLALDPTSGGVRVLVGGRDYLESSFNRSTQAYRCPGSLFKPIVYLTALTERVKVKDMLKANLREKSTSEPSVELCARVGADKVCEMARCLGIETRLLSEPMVALGRFTVSPLQLATVYSTIAAGGILHKPYFITRVENEKGEVLEEVQGGVAKGTRVVDEHVVAQVRGMLQAVIGQGTSQDAQIGRPCAGMAGTSDGHKDAWFAGFSADISCLVWLGYDDKSSMGSLHPGLSIGNAL